MAVWVKQVALLLSNCLMVWPTSPKRPRLVKCPTRTSLRGVTMAVCTTHCPLSIRCKEFSN